MKSDQLLQLLTPIIGLIVSAIAAKLFKNKEARQYFEEALENAIYLGYAIAKEKLGPKATPAQLQARALEEAQKYVTDHVPGALKLLKVSPTQLGSKLKARFSKLNSRGMLDQDHLEEFAAELKAVKPTEPTA